ncbi:integral membrane protein-like protein [Teratosphaeria destructans]|uniref:Integral membrane protein-like protein n=1 Tax=Teratosphaeria destructans TaxID=418781 RepID=A0A9W7W361_9PEZI|nr:integral membrane protein-like protein [Teratosphaeria destructans]
MRVLAIIPVVCSVAALVLSFLCLFAGSKKGFLEDYALVTLNTSRIGVDVFNTTDTSSSSNLVINWLDNLTSSIENEIEGDINSLVRSIAKDLGLHDFYSAYILNYCEGYYTPAAVPNATLRRSSIDKNVTHCSNPKDGYIFDPRVLLQADLNRTGNSNVNLSTLQWPDAIDKGLKDLHIVSKAMFVLYCIATAFIGVGVVLAMVGLLLDGRLSAFVNIVVDCMAFVASLLASALATAVVVKGTHVINKYGHDIGISAKEGRWFLAITWAATALVLVASCVWCVEGVVGCSHRRGRPKFA